MRLKTEVVQVVEILGGDELQNSFTALGIQAKNTYKDSRYEVWELSDGDFEKICNVPDEEWREDWGWWRCAEGCNLDSFPTHSFKVNNEEMIGWYDEYALDEFIESEKEIREDEHISDDELTKEFLSTEYSDLTDYLSQMFGASTEKNVCAISIGLAKLNGITLGQLFEKYQGGQNG